MSIVIQQATWGDENAATDITKSMQEKAKQGYLDLVADNKLVPALDLLSGDKDVVLTDDEKGEIKKKATEVCGSASDEKCINFNKNQFESSLLQKKIAEKQSSANIITGRRLTLTYKDEATGRSQTVAIPDGQKVVAGKKPEFAGPDLSGLTPSSTILGALGYVGQFMLTMLWVFSIAVTYHLLILTGNTITAYVLTAISIVVPYSGLLLTPVALAYFKYRDVKASAPKVVPT
jgi:hypothetical protein